MTTSLSVADTSADTSRISISAHYTGYVWYKHGLSASAFVTPMGRLANALLTPVNALLKGLAGAHIDTFLLQRHQVLDHLLTELIEQEGVEQIVELAAGLSPRGYRISERYPQVTYIETDLPGMAARKAALLQQLQRPARHRVQACNILQQDGPESLQAVLGSLDKQRKTVVISEGLVNYFPLPVIREVWSRLARELHEFPTGTYLTDLYPDFADHPSYRYVKFAQKLVGFFTRGEWPLHYPSDAAIQAGFGQDGFSKTEVHDPAAYYERLNLPRARSATLVRLIRART